MANVSIKDVIQLDVNSVSGVSITAAEAAFLGSSVAGSVPNSLATCVVCDTSRNIANLGNITSGGTVTANSLTDGTATLTGGTLSGVTLGAATTLTSPVLNTGVSGTAIQFSAEGLNSNNTKLASAAAIQDALDALALAAGTGNVVGPTSATDNGIARFDLTTGKLIQNSAATIDDSGYLTCSQLRPTTDLSVLYGGTGRSSFDQYHLLMGAGSSSALLNIANTTTAGLVLTSTTGAPAWAAPSTGGTVTNNGLLTDLRIVKGDGGTVIQTTGISIDGANNISGAAIINCANVQPTNELTVPYGGTGLDTVPANYLMAGNITGDFKTIINPSSNDLVLTSNANALPSWQAAQGNVIATADFVTDNSILIADGGGKNCNSSGAVIISSGLANGGTDIPNENAVYDHVASVTPTIYPFTVGNGNLVHAPTGWTLTAYFSAGKYRIDTNGITWWVGIILGAGSGSTDYRQPCFIGANFYTGGANDQFELIVENGDGQTTDTVDCVLIIY